MSLCSRLVSGEMLGFISFSPTYRAGHNQDAYLQADYLLRMLRATQAVNAGEIAQQCENKNVIVEKVRETQIMAVERAIKG